MVFSRTVGSDLGGYHDMTDAASDFVFRAGVIRLRRGLSRAV